ncbi:MULTISPECIES: hypothetical protein [Bacillus]|uniref:hypothetical protein n=1 Tax=Bacillus TaxID=1386 RepID=UPI0009343E8E|nr:MULTISPECIES: hypothetical protein [Bacillus]OJT56877.1 hypothetical protein BFP49_22550 [Bacillus licheniformis]
MFFILRKLFSLVIGILLLLVIGKLIFAFFPETVPIWEEAKSVVIGLYHTSVAKIGLAPTLFLIVVLIGGATVGMPARR